MPRPLLACVPVLAFCGTALAGPGPAPEPTPRTEVRGMTVSCPTWGGEWGTDTMVETMRKLRDLGVNWVAIHPYAGIREDGTVSMPQRWYDEPQWITRPIEEAHKLGMKMMIKPHIAYWGSPFGWRGDITFEDDESWTRFFESYEDWIVRLGEISADADAFVVGTELDRTIQHETQWRHVVKMLREQYKGPITYSANWNRVDEVPFWDAVDVIGVQSYFPLVGHEKLPEIRELDRGWDRVLRQLETLSKKHGGKKVVLGELGYNRSSAAAIRPWEYRSGGPEAEEVQRRCLSSALRALERSDVIVGAFLWKWFPGESRRGNFLKSTPAMQEVIETHWCPACP